MAVGVAQPQPLPPGAATMAARHVGCGLRLINEDEPLGLKVELVVEPGMEPSELDGSSAYKVDDNHDHCDD